MINLHGNVRHLCAYNFIIMPIHTLPLSLSLHEHVHAYTQRHPYQNLKVSKGTVI